MFNINNDTIVTLGVHNGIFHADDVLCAAMLRWLYKEGAIGGLEIVRTRDPKVLETCNIVCDIGGDDIVTDDRIMFDHHQTDSEEYPNGIKMAACGKLFRYLNSIEGIFELDTIEVDYLLEHLFYPVEAQDNGQVLEAVKCPNQLSFVNIWNTDWDEPQELQDERFQEAVSIATEIFGKFLKRAQGVKKIHDTMVTELTKYSGDGILSLEKFVPWNSAVLEYNRSSEKSIKAVIFPAMNGGYNVQMVPVKEGTFETYTSLPWRGLKGPELEDASGISGAIFCHPAGFISGWKTREAALEAATKALA